MEKELKDSIDDVDRKIRAVKLEKQKIKEGPNSILNH